MENNTILSICIPIYNRLKYLEMMLESFIEDKDLFISNEIQLFVSDNCSTENIDGCISKFLNKGLPIEYYRHKSNIGMDGNFINCLINARGKYVWLLGSDDILEKGMLKMILGILKKYNLNLLHIKNQPLKNTFRVFNDSQQFLKNVSLLITFISSNIVSTKFISTINFEKYKGSFFIQVPLYLTAATADGESAVCGTKFLVDIEKKSGGYNIFDIFVNKYLGIYREFVYNGLVSRKTFKKLRFDMFRTFICPHAYEYLVLKKETTFDLTNGKEIIKKEFSNELYYYYYPIWFLIKRQIKMLLNIVHR